MGGGGGGGGGSNRLVLLDKWISLKLLNNFGLRDLMKSGIIWKEMKCESIFFPSTAKKCVVMEGKK